MSVVSRGDTVDVNMLAGGTISMYEPVMIDTSVTTGGTVIRITATTDKVYGWSQTDATSGQTVSVRLEGVTGARVSATGVTVGDLVTIDGTDKCEIVGFTESGAGTTLTWVHGIVEKSGVSNDIVPLRIMNFRTTV